jgi:hypothetical protein
MRTFALTLAVVYSAALAGGCVYGMTAEKLTTAHEPAGVTVRIITDQRQLSGELIDVRDAGLIVVSEMIVRLVPYDRIVSAQFDQWKDRLAGRRPPSADRRARLRRLSRYPQGLGPDLLRELLHAYGQDELKGVEP